MRRLDELGHEVKFLLPAATAAAARLVLAGGARPDPSHAEGRVESIYFDDLSARSLGDKLASDWRKVKVRLRWYDGGGPVFLERKERIGSRRSKLRVVVPLAGEELAARGLAALAGFVPGRHAAALGAPLAADLRPVLRLRYRRERFVTSRGERLAFDREIEALEAAPGFAPRRGPVRLGTVLVELKGSRRELPAACAPLAALGARRGSFSKYAACALALGA